MYMSKNNHATKKKITLLLLRHGERADEVAQNPRKSRGSKSRKERMDPDLTSVGCRQAAEAFDKIMPCLRGKKVGVFTSPLRRTMATAAMIGMYKRVADENLDFAIPGGTSSSESIPIIVVNGLSDCAAHVRAAGGAYAAVRDGYVDGAAMAANDCSIQSPIMQLMKSIQEMSNLNHPVQFYKETGPGFVAMTNPIGESTTNEESLQQQQVTSSDTQGLLAHPTNKELDIMPAARKRQDDFFFQTLRRIVRMATANDCDVCVLVTHREGIRDLVANIQPGLRVSTPYCCIGRFSAQLQDDDTVQWEFHDVLQYQKFKA